jgi:hypothetical protein
MGDSGHPYSHATPKAATLWQTDCLDNAMGTFMAASSLSLLIAPVPSGIYAADTKFSQGCGQGNRSCVSQWHTTALLKTGDLVMLCYEMEVCQLLLQTG